ncbi:hypothetical protein SBADM41S_10879 [Streptomyces badius]
MLCRAVSVLRRIAADMSRSPWDASATTASATAALFSKWKCSAPVLTPAPELISTSLAWA